MRDGNAKFAWCKKRTDSYDSSIPNRTRLCREALDELIVVLGSQRTGVKVPLVCDYNIPYDSDLMGLKEHLGKEFNKIILSFIKLNEAITFDRATAKEKFEHVWRKHGNKLFIENF